MALLAGSVGLSLFGPEVVTESVQIMVVFSVVNRAKNFRRGENDSPDSPDSQADPVSSVSRVSHVSRFP